MSRNAEIRRILESREIARLEREQMRKAQDERDAKRGCAQQLDATNLYCRDSRFPWK